jgi:hypothetical protein
MACIVRMHGWAIKHRTTSYDLPTSAPNPSQNHPHAMPPCLSHQKLGKDNPKGSPLAPEKKTLRSLTQESQEVQEAGQRTARQSQRPKNASDLPFSGRICHLQGWLSR